MFHDLHLLLLLAQLRKVPQLIGPEEANERCRVAPHALILSLISL